MATLTLLCPDGSIASILDLPAGDPVAVNAITLNAAALCAARGWSLLLPAEWAVPSGAGPQAVTPARSQATADVCHCQSGGVCDVSHDPTRCACRQCVASNMLSAILRSADKACDAANDVVFAHGLTLTPWPRDAFPLARSGRVSHV